MTDKKKDQSVSQVAEIFGCDAQTVRNWIAAGKMKAYQLGGDGAYRIPWAEIERAKAEWKPHHIIEPQGPICDWCREPIYEGVPEGRKRVWAHVRTQSRHCHADRDPQFRITHIARPR